MAITKAMLHKIIPVMITFVAPCILRIILEYADEYTAII